MNEEREELGETRLVECSDELIDAVLTAATSVHRYLGPGLLESVYERALAIELEHAGIPFERQLEITAYYRGRNIGTAFRADIVVDKCLLLEPKAIDDFSPLHLAQVITYLKLLKFKRGFLINFNKQLLKQGIKRVSI